ncbi:MAG: diguanylate cyclase, partial [Sphingobium sp.]
MSEEYINELTGQGYGLIVGKDPRGRTEYVVIDPTAIEAMAPRNNAAPAALTSNKSEDIAGEKIDQKWTEFDQASGTLGIDRAQMPQIKAEHRGAMVNFLNARGITSEQANVLPTDLKATQREFSPAKVEQAKGFTGNDRSILVSSDGHILDGHHQWLAKRESGQPVKVIRLNAPIRELLTAVSEFPSAQTAAGASVKQSAKSDTQATLPVTGDTQPTIEGATNGTADAAPAALAQASGEAGSDNGVQGVPDALALPDGSGLGSVAAGTDAGSQADIPAGPADRNDAVSPVIARVGSTPNSAEPVTVRNGVVHIGENPAQDFESGEDITVPDGSTPEQVADALRNGKALSTKQRVYMGAKGMRQVRAPAKPTQPERRADNARRQAVAEMDVETLRRELLTDALTGLGNRRAYDESEKLPAQVSIDADSLKWINDNLGHASGDKLLKAIGQALGGETRNAYHVSGDEFIVQAATEAEAQAIMDRAVARMADARIDATNADGQDIVLT